MAEAPRPPNWRHPLRDAALSEAFLTSLALLLALPLTNPEIVLATGLLNLFVGLHLPRGPLTLLLSHSLFCLSYAALTLKARLAGFDPSLELAAQDLGAPPLEAFRRVTLTLLVTGLLAAAPRGPGLPVRGWGRSRPGGP